MGLTKEQREKRTKLVVMAKRGEGNEAAVAATKVVELDARSAESEPKHREWGDGRTRKARPEPVLTENEKREYAVATIGPLQQALAAATVAGDIKGLKDVAAIASALKEGARARGMGVVSENQAAEVVVRAERAMGRVLLALEEDGLLLGRGSWTEREQGGKTVQNIAASNVLRLADLDITPPLAFKLRLLARLADAAFEALLAEKRDGNERIAKVDFYRAATPVEAHQTPIAKAARHDLVEAMQSESAITQVTDWLEATDALLALTDALPTEELRSVGLKATELVAWYNLQKQQRS